MTTQGRIPVEGQGVDLDTTVIIQDDGKEAHREVVTIGDPMDDNAYAKVSNAAPSITDYGTVTRPLPVPHPSMGNVDLTVDAWGIPKVSLPVSLYHGLFTFDIPASMWFMYENGTQVYTSTNIVSTDGAAVITADATNTNVILESRESPRYQPNRGHLVSFSLICPSKTANGKRTFGLGTDENGVSFRLKSDGLLYAVRESGGVETEELIDATLLPDGFDVEKGNVYDIQFQWRGVGSFFFYVNLKLVHAMEVLGTLDALSIENPALPIRMQCERTTQDVTMKIGCVDITSENGLADIEQYGSAYAESVSVNGTDAPVLVVHNPLQISSTTNTRSISLARVSPKCSKKATFKVWVTRDVTAITGATLKAIGSGSYVETDSTDMDATAVRATSVDTSKMRFITAIPVEAAVGRSVDNPAKERIQFNLVRGDYLVVTCTASTATAEVVDEWGEQV